MRDSLAEARRWLLQAKNDLAFTGLARREGFFAQTCFLSQQTAEKAVKALLYADGERVVLGHSLVELLRRRPEDAEMATLREAAAILDQYYVATRYPNGLPGGLPFESFTQGQAEEALSFATRFVELAEGRISIEPLDQGGKQR